MLKLPEHRYGLWYMPSGRIIAPRHRAAYWAVTYTMAGMMFLLGCLIISAICGVAIGILWLWVQWPDVVEPVLGTLVALSIVGGIIHAIARDMTR